MELGLLEKGVPLSIAVEGQSLTTYGAKFYEIVSDRLFWAESPELYKSVAQSNPGERANLRVSFSRGQNFYVFTGRIVKTELRGYNKTNLVQIEQITEIEVSSQREYPRRDVFIDVKLYGLSETDLNAGRYVKSNEIPVFKGSSLDISAGGLGIVSNDKLNSKYEPYFLVEFSLGPRDMFLLPGKLVRKGNCPQLAQYKFDYGLMFIFDGIPDEKNRLVTAIFSAMIAALNR